MRVYKSFNCEHMYIIHSKDCSNYTSKINCDGSYQKYFIEGRKNEHCELRYVMIVNEDTSKCTIFL